MANGIYVWDGNGWNPGPDIMTAVIIPPSAYPPGTVIPTVCTLNLSAYTVTKGTTVTLTATITAGVAGTVAFQYLSGFTWLTWSTKTVSANKAITTNVPSATVTYRAIFNPSNPVLYRSSTSGPQRATVTTSAPTPTTPITIGSSGNAVGTYKGTGAKRGDTNGDDAYYGYYSSFNGDQRAYVVLAGASAINAVAKSAVKSATITVTSRHTYPNVGTTLRFVPGASGSVPSSYSGKPSGGFTMKVPNSGSATATIPLSIAQLFCAGSAYKALVVIAAVSGANGYGFISGDSIRITFNRK